MMNKAGGNCNTGKRHNFSSTNQTAACSDTTVSQCKRKCKNPGPISSDQLDDLLVELKSTIALLYRELAVRSQGQTTQTSDFEKRLQFVGKTIKECCKQGEVTENQQDAINFCKELFEADFSKLLDELNTSDDSEHMQVER